MEHTVHPPRNVLIVGGRDNWIIAARQLGLRFSMIQCSEMLTPLQRELGDALHIVSRGDHQQITALATELQARERFGAVITSYEPWMVLAATLAQTLEVAGLPLTAVERSRNKLLFRQVTNDHPRIPFVEYSECRNVSDVEEFQRAMRGPIIVKPIQGTASDGVSRVDDPAQIEAAVRWVRSADDWMAGNGDSFLCERYVEGRELSVDMMSNAGEHRILAINEKMVFGQHHVSVGHSLPAVIDTPTVARIAAVMGDMLDAIGNTTGPTHTEFKLEADTPRIIETQTRFGGGNIWNLVELTTGINVPKHTLETLLGLPLSRSPPVAAAAAVRYLLLAQGTLTRIEDFSDVSNMAGVQEVSVTVTPGSRVGPVRRSDERPGYVICCGPDLEAACRNANLAAAALRDKLTITTAEAATA